MNALKTWLVVCLGLSLGALCAEEVTRARFPDADAVILDEHESVAYRPDGTYETIVESRTKVLTERGQREERVISFDYNARYGKAEILSLGVIGTNGVERAIDFAATMRESTDNSSMRENIVDPLDRKVTCTIPGLQVGEVVHLKMRRAVVKSRIQDQWSDATVMEWTYPILRSVYEVKAPAERPIRSRAIRHPLGNVVSTERKLPDGSMLYTYTATNSPRIFPEPDMPPTWTQVQNVRLSTAADWREISRWYWQLCEPRLACTTAAMTNKVNEIGRDVRALFKFVSQEVRYMGLTMEDDSPGYAPHDVNITFDNRYGVCRDKAGLLVAMLRIAGFRAFPVLINVGAKMDPDVPQPYFNHAIVAVEQDERDENGERSYLLMDPTNENTKDLFPAYLCSRSYLVARPDGDGLRTSPVPPPEKNSVDIVSTARLAKDGSMVLENTIDFTGINDTAYRGALVRRTPELRTVFFERVVQVVAPGAELVKCEIEPRDLRDTDVPMKVTLLSKLPGMVLKGRTENRLNVPMVSSSLGLVLRLLDGNTLLEERKYPLVLDSTARTKETLSIDLGDALGEVKELPDDRNLAGGLGYRRTFSLSNGTLRVNRVLSLNAVEFAPNDYQELRERMKAIEVAERQKPVFFADATRGADVHTILDSSETDILSDRSWVVTNEIVQQVLTYQGRKRLAERTFSYNPTWKKTEILSATVSNRNGRVYALKPSEMNILDCGWASSAPRYPAGKLLVVNLPSVEIGSVISIKSVITVTNAPTPFYAGYFFDSYNPTDRRVVRVDGWRREEVKPPRLAVEPMQPGDECWRDYEVVSYDDFDAAARRLRSAVDVGPINGSDDLPNFSSLSIAEICTWMQTNVRIVGPSLYELPIDCQLTAPEIVLKERYATRLDYVRTLCALLRGAGYEADIVFAADNANDSEAIRRRDKYEKPNVRAFAFALCRVRERVGGFLGFGGECRETFVGTEGRYSVYGATAFADCDYFDPETGTFGVVKPTQSDYVPREVTQLDVQVRENGAVDIDSRTRLWGPGVAAFRRKYSEILPEDRERDYQSLVGSISMAASATSELETDVKSYPAELTFSCFVPNYATVEGDTISLSIHSLAEALFPLTGSVRESPLGIPATDASETEVRVIFPEGYTEVEHLPDEFCFRNPLNASTWCACTVRTELDMSGRLVVTVRRTVNRRKADMLDATYFQLLKDWNRLATSRSSRTLSVRRVKVK